MKVLIFTEGGSLMGLGHITRCISIYDEIVARNIEVEFIINGDQKIKNIIGNRKYKIENWLNKKYLESLDLNNKYCIVDSYNANYSTYYFISKHSTKLLCIDDINRLTYPKSIVVNPSLYTKEHNYPEVNNIKYLLGKDYIILRKAFNDSISKAINQEVENILITLGGSDIRNLTPQILEVLIKYPKIKKNVVVGNGFNNINEIKEFSDENTTLFFNLNENEMKDLMTKSDIAITAAGQTVYELIRVGIPFIPIQVINNQQYTTKGLIKNDLAEKIIYWNASNLRFELACQLIKVCDIEKRTKLSKKYQSFIDGFGTSRIVSLLLEDDLL